VFNNPNAKANPLIEYNQKALAAYLARARGPGQSSMKFTQRPRATGEAARATWTLYDLPLNPDRGIGVQGVKYNPNDGTDWSLGTTSRLGQLPHDGGMARRHDLLHRQRSQQNVSIGKVNAKTAR